LLIALLPAQAQQSTDGSLYSRLGLGTMQSTLSSQAEGMGGAGTALISPNYLSMSNPASWSSQILTRFIGSYRYQSVGMADAQGNSSRLNAGSVGGGAFSLPLLTRRLGFVAAYTPVTRVGYQLRQPGTLPAGPGNGDATDTGYETVFDGSGGLQSIRGGLGYRINRFVRLGASVDYYFGILERHQRTTFDSGDFLATQYARSTRLSGVTGTVGGIFLIPTILSDGDYLSIGISARLPTSLTAERVTTVGETLSRDTVGTVQKGTVDFPAQLQAGLAYQASNYVSFTLDGLIAPWKNFESTLPFTGYDPEGGSSFTDRWRVGAGFEYRPAGYNENAPYIQRVMYRVGASVDQSYVKPHPEVDLRQYAVTGGVSFPTTVAGNRIDLNLELGQQGTTDYNLIKDTYYTASIVVNFGERWFVKRPIQ
jgi:hypothetical protein